MGLCGNTGVIDCGSGFGSCGRIVGCRDSTVACSPGARVADGSPREAGAQPDAASRGARSVAGDGILWSSGAVLVGGYKATPEVPVSRKSERDRVTALRLTLAAAGVNITMR